jgi:hypothetical protein
LLKIIERCVVRGGVRGGGLWKVSESRRRRKKKKKEEAEEGLNKGIIVIQRNIHF